MVGKASATTSSSTSSSGYYPIMDPDPPLTLKEVDVMKEYASSLEDLTLNSKPLINMLTMLAEENRASARAIVLAIEHHLRKVATEVKLPVLYLIDSIIKNVGNPYSTLFNQNIVQMFCSVFEKGDEKTRVQLFKLRHTWNQMLPAPKLYALDVHVNNFDPAWPVQQLSAMMTTIHVNPKFLSTHVQSATATPPVTSAPTATTPAVATVAPIAATPLTTNEDKAKSEATLRENLRRKQKKLLELRQKKLELELLQTKEKLREQEMLQQQQQQLQQAAAAANLSADKHSSTHRRRSKHSSSSSSSKVSDLEKRTRLSQQLKQELVAAQARLPAAVKTPAPTTAALTPTTTSTTALQTSTAKVTPPSGSQCGDQPQPPPHHTSPLSSAAMAAKTQQAAAAVAATGAQVMRIAPVSSQLLNAVQKRATRDPRLLRAAQNAAANVTTVTKTSLTPSAATKSGSSGTSVTTKTSSGTSVTTKTSSGTLVTTKSGNVTTKSASFVTKDGSISVTLSKSSGGGGGGVTSSKCEVTVSDSVAADDLVASKKSRTSSSQSPSNHQHPITVSVPFSSVAFTSVTTTPTSSSVDVVVKSSSSSSSPIKVKSRSSSSESGGSKQQKKQTTDVCSSAAVAATTKTIDSVTEKDSLDLDKERKETSQSPQQEPEVATPPSASSELRIGQLPASETVAPPTGVKRLSEERDLPPPKKTKVMERFVELFGESGEEKGAAVEAAPTQPELESSVPSLSPTSITAAAAAAAASAASADDAAQVAPLAETNDTNSRGSGGGPWSKYKAHRQTCAEPYPGAVRTTKRDKDIKDTDQLEIPMPVPMLYIHETPKETKVNGNDEKENDMEISTEEDNSGETIKACEPIKSEKESVKEEEEEEEEKNLLKATDDNDDEVDRMSYEPLQPPPMPPAFLPRRSSEEEEMVVKKEVKLEEVKEEIIISDVDIRKRGEEEEDSVVKQEVLMTAKVGDVDNRLRFPSPVVSMAALSPPQDGLMATDAVTNPFAGPAVPAVINSTKDIDLRIGLQRPLVMPPVPMDADFGGGVEKAVADSSSSSPSSARPPPPHLAPPAAPLPPDEGGPKGGPPPPPHPPAMPPGAWGPGGPAWMMQPPVQCWPQGAFPPGLHPPNVVPLWPPPMPPQVMFEPDSNARLCRPLAPPPPPHLMPPVGGGESIDLPAADLSVLEAIADDTMKSIEIDGTPRDIRYYGDTAVVFLAWDDPREILFQSSGPRKLIIDDRQTVMLSFNAPYQEVIIDNHTYPVRLGGPTRELYVGAQFYQVLFGGPPISVALGPGDRLHKLQMEGPPPQVRIGRPRRDLCLGKITLIVDARHHYTIYLDPKAQRFDLDGVPHIIRFVQALETTVINGVPFKFEFGGLPRPIFSRGKKHYVRLTNLPQGVVPGYVDILGMEGGRRGDPPRAPLQQAPQRSAAPVPAPAPAPAHVGLMIDTNSQGSDGHRTPPNDANKPKSSSNPSGSGLNIQELLQKLMATGIMANNASATGGGGSTTTSYSTNQSETTADQGAAAANQDKAASGDDQSEATDSHIDTTHTSDKIEFVDFGKPQTLKVRQPGLIKQLYSGIQCSSCGVRFAPEQTIKYSQHLDWHFRQNRRERDSARTVHSRTWYYDLSDWTQFEEIEDIEERALSWFDTQILSDGEGGSGDGGADGSGLDVPSVACDSDAVDVRCALCRDRFDIFYNEDKEEWHVRRACKQENAFYHPLCWDDHLASLKTPEPEEVEKQEEPIIASIIIDEDDSEEAPKKEDDNDGEGKTKEEVEEEDDDVIIQEPEHKMEIIELLKDDDEEEEEAAKEEEERSRMKENSVGGDESSTMDKKDSEDGNTTDSTSKPPTDFHSVLRNIKKEKMDAEVECVPDDEIIDLDSSSVNTRRELEEDEQRLGNQPPPVVDTTQVKVACSIDGNVELVDSGAANMLAAPSKIKINISKATTATSQTAADQSAVAAASKEVEPPPVYRPVVSLPPSQPPPSASMVVPLDALVESSQPPPPGEEPGPLNLKPKLIGHKLTELQPVSRGTELSGLCSIM